MPTVYTLEADLSELETKLAAQGLEIDDLRTNHRSLIDAAQATAWDALDDAGDAASRGYEAEIAAKTYTDQRIQALRDELNLQVQGVHDYVVNDVTPALSQQVTTATTQQVANYRDRLDQVYALADRLGIDMSEIEATAAQITNVELPSQLQWLTDLDLAVLVLTGKLDNWDIELGLNEPVKPVLVLESEVAPEGRAKIIAHATSPTPIERWVFEISEDDGLTWFSDGSSGPTKTWTGARGYTYLVRVTGFRRNKSTPVSDVQSITTFLDAVPPAPPTGLKIRGMFGGFFLEWDKNTENDFDEYELFEGETAEDAPDANSTPSYVTAATSMFRAGLNEAVERYFWIRAVDTSGNASDWAEPVNDTSLQANVNPVTPEDLAGMIELTAFAQGIEPVTMLEAVPLEKQTEVIIVDGRLYRWEDGEYTDDVVANQIVGKLTAAQIGVGAVRAEQLAAGAAVISKLGILDFENLVTNGGFTDPVETGYNGSHSYSNLRKKGSRSLSIPSGNTYVNQKDEFAFEVDEGAEYWGETFIRTTSGSSSGFYVQIDWLDADKDFLDRVGIAGNESAGTSWKRATNEFSAPNGARFGKVRIVNTGSRTLLVDRVCIRRRNGAELIVDGSIKANHVDVRDLVVNGIANINEAFITDAHITELSANKLRVLPGESGLPFGMEIGSTGTNLGTIRNWANDPANRINNGEATKIAGGKISVYGPNTLNEYFNYTEINGGRIDTGTVVADAIRLRDLTEANSNSVADERSLPSSHWRFLCGVGLPETDPDAQITITAECALIGADTVPWGLRITNNTQGGVLRSVGSQVRQGIVAFSVEIEGVPAGGVYFNLEGNCSSGNAVTARNLYMYCEQRRR